MLSLSLSSSSSSSSRRRSNSPRLGSPRGVSTAVLLHRFLWSLLLPALVVHTFFTIISPYNNLLLSPTKSVEEAAFEAMAARRQYYKHQHQQHDASSTTSSSSTASTTLDTASTNSMSSGFSWLTSWASGTYDINKKVSSKTDQSSRLSDDENNAKNRWTAAFDYNQVPIRTHTTLSDPILPNHTSTSTIILILSARKHAAQRMVIRETWGQDHTIIFCIGADERVAVWYKNESTTSSDDNNNTEYIQMLDEIQANLTKEQKQYHDLLDSLHPESYRSLPHKVLFGYQHIIQNYRSFKWIIKVDDDTVVRVDTLKRTVLDYLQPSRPMVLGSIIVNSAVARSGQWAELSSYKPDFYPYWAKGSCGHVVSRPVAEYLVRNKDNLTFYQGEDTTLGIWLDEAVNFTVRWISMDRYFVNHGKCENEVELIIGHQISPLHMRECYQKMDEWDKDRLRQKSVNLWHVETEHQKLGSSWSSGGGYSNRYYSSYGTGGSRSSYYGGDYFDDYQDEYRSYWRDYLWGGTDDQIGAAKGREAEEEDAEEIPNESPQTAWW